MSSLPVDLNLGYDPTTVERGPHVRPKALPSLPPTATVTPAFLPPPQAQGTTQHEGSPGTCAAWATTYGLATYTAAAAAGQAPSTPALQASPAHIYIEVMKSYGVTTCQGSQISSYLDILSQGGTPNWQTAQYYPNCPQLWSTYDPNAAVDASFEIPGWAWVETSDLTSIKTILASGGALCYGTALNTGFMTYDGTPSPMTGPLNKMKNANGSLVGHCMLIIGYDDSQNAVLIQNSFGPTWGCQWNGSGGYVWMGYDLFQYLSQGSAAYVTS